MRILKNDTADFSIEIKNLDNLYIAKVTESHIRFVYDGKRYILSKDDSDDEFMTLYKTNNPLLFVTLCFIFVSSFSVCDFFCYPKYVTNHRTQKKWKQKETNQSVSL